MNIDAMVAAYAECAFWSSSDWDNMVDGNPTPFDENYGPEDLADATLASFTEDCETFADSNAGDLDGMDAAQAGHDFWLTRNGHGAGFWDRGLGERGERLTVAAHIYGSVDLVVGDDGKVYG